jgi:hypothetical protein
MSMRNEAAGRRVALAIALVVAATATSPAAVAQTDPATKEAESRFKEGLAHHDAGDEEGARLSFLQAYSVLKRPNILYNLARAEQLTGHPVEAIQHYKIFVEDSTVAAGDRDTAKKRILELTPLVGHVSFDAPVGTELWVDGQMLASKAPLSEAVDVAPGTHSVQGRLGDTTKTVTVSCAAGQTATAKIDIVLTGPPLVLVPMPGESPPAPPPGAAETGSHGASSTAKIVTVTALGAGAIAFLAAGIGFEVASSSEDSDRQTFAQSLGNSPTVCNRPSPSNATVCSEWQNAAQAHARDGNLAAGMLATAGVLAAAAVVTWSVWPKRRDGTSAGARVVPMASPQLAGLGVVGSF